MPELPEVEFCFQHLTRWLDGRRIVSGWAHDGAPLREISALDFQTMIKGRRVEGLHRHGKQIFAYLSGSHTLWLHLGMTGKWVQAHSQERRRWCRVALELDEGPRLEFVDPRKFGRIKLLPTVALPEAISAGGLGPDALTVCESGSALRDRLNLTRRPIKTALLDQHRLAGVGNIYAAEALFDAQIDPRRPAVDLSNQEYNVLAASLRHAMVISIERELGGEIKYLHEGKPKNPFLVYGREGEPCPRCTTPIRRMTQSGRSTFYCAPCQHVSV